MASLKTNIGNLEELKTLPMVIKNLQTDADLNQPLNKQDHNVNCWEKVTESQKRGEALTVTKNDMVISNQFELFPSIKQVGDSGYLQLTYICIYSIYCCCMAT